MKIFYLFSLAKKSAWNRRGSLVLAIFSVALSTALLLGVERIRTQVKDSFTQTISGTDLIVGARGGDIELTLYAIFHLGSAANNMNWKSAKEIAALDEIAWTIPISLGDSHKGYPVTATNADFFEHYKFRGGKRLEIASGKPFGDIFDVTMGFEAAKKLGYKIGDRIVLSHGEGRTNLAEHSDKPFSVVGILSPTGTVIDRSLYISLEAMEAIHIDWQGGAPITGLSVSPEMARKFDLEPKSITALLVGLKKRSKVFAVQREINEWQSEALSAVMPGVTMDRIWRTINIGERALAFISVLVTVAGLLGLTSAILAGLGERRRELAVLRSAGARPMDIVALLSFEGVLLVVCGVGLGAAALGLLIAIFGPIAADSYGIEIYLSAPSAVELAIVGAITLAGFLTSLIPAVRAYRMSLSDGLAVVT
ncbi:MAG: hypothetical protein LBQ18_07290 [Campylobacteraceae bacterium]|jgi:putative ABC transport system permease protein|nr:hypothetical protein [Campylobacteraceae bacterium]